MRYNVEGKDEGIAIIKIKCIVKNRRKEAGVQCLKYKNYGRCFQESYSNKVAKPETKRLIIIMSVNRSGIIDISRMLEISKDTVMNV